MEIFNVNVYGLKESVIRSGYPMQTQVEKWESEDKKEELFKKGLNRLIKLGNARSGSGHDCALKGISVQFDIKAPQHFWLQWERYHFQDTISSTSTMHRIISMDIKKACTHRVDHRIIDILNEKIDVYNKSNDIEDFYRIIDNIPSGLQLTRSITMNYLQLKTMYQQREKHKMYTWNEFCTWLDTLPYFKEFCINKELKNRLG